MNASLPRVIFVNRVYWPSQAATAQLLTDLAEGLAAHGWTVHVVAAGDGPDTRNGVAIHRTGEGDQHGGLVSRVLNYRRFIRRARWLLAAMVRPGDIVVPMTDPPMLGAAIAGIALRQRAHLVHWIQDIYPEIVTAQLGAAFGFPFWPLSWKRDAAWRSAHGCVTLGEDMAQTIAVRGVPADNITVIPNWAPRELQLAADPSAIAAQRAEWGVTGKFVVAYSGNLGRVHEFATVLDAAELLHDRPEFVFLFIGTGPRLAEIRAAAQTRGLRNIQFLPPVPRQQLAVSLAGLRAVGLSQQARGSAGRRPAGALRWSARGRNRPPAGARELRRYRRSGGRSAAGRDYAALAGNPGRVRPIGAERPRNLRKIFFTRPRAPAMGGYTAPGCRLPVRSVCFGRIRGRK